MANIPEGRHVEGATQEAFFSILKAMAGRDKSQPPPNAAALQQIMVQMQEQAKGNQQARGLPPGLFNQPQPNHNGARLPAGMPGPQWNGIYPIKAAASLQAMPPPLQQLLRNLPLVPNQHSLASRQVPPAQLPVATSSWNVKPDYAVHPGAKEIEHFQMLSKLIELRTGHQADHIQRLVSQALSTASNHQPAQPPVPQQNAHLPQMLEALAPFLLANQQQQLQQRVAPVLPPRQPVPDPVGSNRSQSMLDMLHTFHRLQHAVALNSGAQKPANPAQHPPVISGPLSFSRPDASLANSMAALLGKRQREELEAQGQPGKPMTRVLSDSRVIGQEASTSVCALSQPANRAASPSLNNAMAGHPARGPIKDIPQEWERTSSQGSGRCNDDASGNNKTLKLLQQAGPAVVAAVLNKDVAAVAAIANAVKAEQGTNGIEAELEAGDGAGCNDALRLAAEALVCLGGTDSPVSDESGRNKRSKGADKGRHKKGWSQKNNNSNSYKVSSRSRENSRDYTTVWSSVLGCYVARSKRSFQPVSGTATGSVRGGVGECTNGDVDQEGGSNGSGGGYPNPKDTSICNRNSTNSHPSANSEC